jgi:ABC-type nickel/cobalt efflux system permease component RcnA
VLGLQHASDPDHLVAVATIVTRERRFQEGALVGIAWGLGHMATVTVAGAIIVSFSTTVPSHVTRGLELVVACMLVLLGAWRLREATRGLGNVALDHAAADHDHGGSGVVHSHPHAHRGDVHTHPHVHPSRRLLHALGGARARWGVLLVGAVHGLAGSATVALLVLTTLPRPASAVVYLLVFGLGTIVGMTALTAAMAYPVALALRLGTVRRGLAVAAGFGSIAFGIYYAARTLGA